MGNVKKTQRLEVNKLFLPYDVYERHRKVASVINANQTVLDVGGELDHLSQFISPAKIIVANLISGDVIITKDKLPFPKDSFDVVCAIDVLEHIPKSNRERFVKNLIRVSSNKVILSFPIGTRQHILYEKNLEMWLVKKKLDVVYLKEHIRFGLPTQDELLRIGKNFETKVYYSGNIRVNNILFKIFVLNPKIKLIGKFIYFLKLLFNFLTNPILYFLLINKPYSQKINRAYVVILKGKARFDL